MLKVIVLLIFTILTGCTPVIDARLRLVDASRKGLAAVGQSVDERQQAITAMQTAERKRLDAAFDADARQQATLTDAWVVEARTAYATALDASAVWQRQSEAAARVDRQNLAAVDTALAQIEALDRSQLSFISLFGGNK